jgi:hypothetical protein
VPNLSENYGRTQHFKVFTVDVLMSHESCPSLYTNRTDHRLDSISWNIVNKIQLSGAASKHTFDTTVAVPEFKVWLTAKERDGYMTSSLHINAVVSRLGAL